MVCMELEPWEQTGRIPSELREAWDKKPPRGRSIFRHYGPITAVQWFDNKDVYMHWQHLKVMSLPLFVEDMKDKQPKFVIQTKLPAIIQAWMVWTWQTSICPIIRLVKRRWNGGAVSFGTCMMMLMDEGLAMYNEIYTSYSVYMLATAWLVSYSYILTLVWQAYLWQQQRISVWRISIIMDQWLKAPLYDRTSFGTRDCVPSGLMKSPSGCSSSSLSVSKSRETNSVSSSLSALVY